MCVCVYNCSSVSLPVTNYINYLVFFFFYINKFHLQKFVCMLLKGIMTTTGSATYSFSKDTALAHMFSSVGWPPVFAALHCHVPVSLH